VPDFGVQRDLGDVDEFTDPGSEFVFGFEADAQTIVNESVVTMEISWDGINVHATLVPGTLEVISYADHLRPRVFVRQAGAAPVGGAQPRFVQVIAATR
jgi:hypothetical protein